MVEQIQSAHTIFDTASGFVQKITGHPVNDFLPEQVCARPSETSIERDVFDYAVKAVSYAIPAALAIAATATVLRFAPAIEPVLCAAGLLVDTAAIGSDLVTLMNAVGSGDAALRNRALGDLGLHVVLFGLSAVSFGATQGVLSRQSLVNLFEESWAGCKELGRAAALGHVDSTREVFILTTTNPHKLAHFQAILPHTPRGSRACVLKLSSDRAPEGVRLASLYEDESRYGNTFWKISRGKAQHHKPQEILAASVTWQGRQGTLQQLFPGRRVLLVTDDSGIGISVHTKRIPHFRREVGRQFRTTPVAVRQTLDQIATSAPPCQVFFGTNTHRHLEYIGSRLLPTQTGCIKTAAEVRITRALAKKASGSSISFTSAVTLRDVKAGRLFTSERAVRGGVASRRAQQGTPSLLDLLHIDRQVFITDLAAHDFPRGKAFLDSFEMYLQHDRSRRALVSGAIGLHLTGQLWSACD